MLVAIFVNDGAMIALSKDNVKPIQNPDAWFLNKVFTAGFGYGLVQALSTLVLFELASSTEFFSSMSSSLPSLNIKNDPSDFKQVTPCSWTPWISASPRSRDDGSAPQCCAPSSKRPCPSPA